MNFELHRNAFGRLVLTDAHGVAHVGVLPVRAFPIGAPGEGLSLVSAQGRELVWIEHLADVPAAQRALIDEELAAREFVPQILRLREVSSFSTPSRWSVDTDRGPTQFVLKGEEDIRRIGRGRLLIADAHGLSFLVHDFAALDRHSKRLLERFL